MGRRLFDTITSAVLLIGLGFMIAVSARSLPGQGEEETLGDIRVDLPEWFGALVQWIALAVAGVLAIYLLMSIRRGERWSWSELKGVLSRLLLILFWAGVFLLVYSSTRPPEQQAPPAGGSPPPAEDVGEIIDVGPSVSAGWMAGALVFLIVAAAIARIALTLRPDPEAIAQIEETPDHLEAPQLAEPQSPVLGTDPRSRVINAYADFESWSKDAGIGRRRSETARHHAERAGVGVGAELGDLQTLGQHYEAARFGDVKLADEDADAAETAWARIRARIGR